MTTTRRSFARSLALSPLAFAAVSRAAGFEEDVQLKSSLESIREKHHLPALIAGLVTPAGLQRVAVTGMRRAGGHTAATVTDQWHLGSDTKAMTAALIAMEVESGRLAWDAPLSSVFTDNTALKASPLGKVTISQLLHHVSGLEANLDWKSIDAKGGGMMTQRREVLKVAARQALRTPPGSTFLYSNTGYVLVGAVLEKLEGRPWEEIIKQRLFAPLGITSAGFGGTGTAGKEDQPWPHQADGTPMPVNGPKADNPPVMGHAGTLHMHLADWAKFIADQLTGARQEKALLKGGSYRMLHAPGPDSYGMGWMIVDRPWAGGQALTHAGSNTMNYCVAWLAPEKNFAVLVCTNRGLQMQAADEAVGEVIKIQTKA